MGFMILVERILDVKKKEMYSVSLFTLALQSISKILIFLKPDVVDLFQTMNVVKSNV